MSIYTEFDSGLYESGNGFYQDAYDKGYREGLVGSLLDFVNDGKFTIDRAISLSKLSIDDFFDGAKDYYLHKLEENKEIE